MKFDVRSPKSWVAALAMAVLIPLSSSASAALTNGNFEDSETSASPWSPSGAASLVADVGRGPSTSNAIRFASALDGGFGSLSQSLAGLTNGTYDLEFWLMGPPPLGTDEFLVEQGVPNVGTTVIGLQNGTAGTDGWTRYWGDFNVTGDFLLMFTADTSFSEDPFNFKLDDVSLTLRTTGCTGNNCSTVPEPGSLLLVGVALGGVAVARRRKML